MNAELPAAASRCSHKAQMFRLPINYVNLLHVANEHAKYFLYSWLHIDGTKVPAAKSQIQMWCYMLFII